MQYRVEAYRSLQIQQGLASAVRNAQNLAPIKNFSLILRIGIVFDESQLNERGWFVDTDSLESHLSKMQEHLQSDTWTALFDFRPTFEQVSRWIYQQLAAEVPQLSFVTLEDQTMHTITTYTKE